MAQRVATHEGVREVFTQAKGRAAQMSDESRLAALTANIPTEMAMKLLRAWHARGYGLDVVLYRKYEGSNWVDPHDEDPVAFKDLPNRFPSVLSRDFRKEQGQYQDVDNLFAMYLLYNLGRYSLRIDDAMTLLDAGRFAWNMGRLDPETVLLPVVPRTTSGGAAVLDLDQPAADVVLEQFR